MKPVFINLTWSKTGESVLINASQISYVRKGDDLSVIVFSDEVSIRVTETQEEIQKLIKEAT